MDMTTSKRRKKSKTPPEISAAEFKARCLGIMDEVLEKGRSFTITKRGRPVARLVPVVEDATGFVGCARGMVSWAVDLTAPTGERWDAENE